ncbi:type II toxin-antitoxin system RelE/ParE family toxin [Nostoc sp. CHAB 5836]|uniref:type II toxin-antitoxin system RelE family toxin n=1 Tax=Nostoc sp. CHAB 5836 TaxID=2780404 RepID=UPI001E5C3811|nr:type II toxin-antitoxin system RelE/ParE family toxin [Nostoc sp. CHAB 5836]MCC5614071.1 type II toxin-antitoxin system RelE/ParE family toxin [Nostoc sp. CHAB 5836]
MAVKLNLNRHFYVYVNADKAVAKKIARCLQQLEQTPQSHPNIKALKGDYAGYYRYRIGDYRVIYRKYAENP